MNTKKNQGLFVIIAIVIILSILTIIIKPKEYRNYDNSNSNNNSNKLNTSFLKISNVSVTNSSSYTTCSGTITVSSYSPYKYKRSFQK